MSANTGRSRRKFTKEFKAEAVAMVAASDGNVAKVAHLRLDPGQLGPPGPRGSRRRHAEDRAEIRELRRELERVKRERDISGKAVAYFSASDPRNA